MTFHSILFGKNEGNPKEEVFEIPPFFVDLNLDQVIDAITAGKQEYDLKPFFYTSLKEVDTVRYRQEIMQDLEKETLFENIKLFAQKLIVMRRYLGMIDKLYFKYHQEGWFLEAVIVYCDAVVCLVRDLSLVNLKSQGFLSFREQVTNYAKSSQFTMLLTETNALKTDLSSIRYCIVIKGDWVNVRKFSYETDYSKVVEQTFEKFKQGEAKDHLVKLPLSTGMNHIEANILNGVAKLYPDIFKSLDSYCVKNRQFLDPMISTFDREIQFYVSYLEYIMPIKQAGLNFCFPNISNQNKEIYDYEGFDLALANKRIHEKSTVVCNDFSLSGEERIIVVSGPNQGGKTTFARSFGQLHYLASLGLPVPGRKAQLFLYDKLFTHFERKEDIRNQRGKLQDDLVRIHYILEQATPNSIIIMNEIFTSTTLNDAIFLSQKIMEKIIQLDLLSVCVSFINELASLSEKTISMVSTVIPETPAIRTYKIVRKHTDGLAYALSIAEKYKLTYECLMERIKE